MSEQSERRERYALALSKLDGWRETHVRDHGQRPEYYAAADAAIAVADEEAAHLGTELVEMGQELSARKREGDRLVELNNRLRAELEERKEYVLELGEDLGDAQRTIERVRSVLDDIDETDRVSDLARVIRAELEGEQQ